MGRYRLGCAAYRQFWQPPGPFPGSIKPGSPFKEMGSAVGPADAMQASNRKQATFFYRFFKAKYRYRSSWKSNSTISRFSSKKIFLRRLPGFSTKTGMTEFTIGSQTGPDNSRKPVSIFPSSISSHQKNWKTHHEADFGRGKSTRNGDRGFPKMRAPDIARFPETIQKPLQRFFEKSTKRLI